MPLNATYIELLSFTAGVLLVNSTAIEPKGKSVMGT